ncbi:internal scaffolding protein [Peromfec virus RodF8_43]|uniref:Internal scaffolding protein n=1 Tax=Peromfec virus RodF8_43 TaxID=2929376 RepID=A0A976N2E8_9VIRU|nr:internal scaffolding protein [Peromfec virus RodF8_43]
MIRSVGPSFSNSGSSTEINWKAKVLPDGTIDFFQDGVLNTYDEIQSYKDSCSIELALERFSLGDTSALQRVQGAYGDFTTFPKTFAEVLQVMINAENYFDSLPKEVRRNFDNDLNKFLASMDDTSSFLEKLGVSSSAPESNSAPESVSVDS